MANIINVLSSIVNLVSYFLKVVPRAWIDFLPKTSSLAIAIALMLILFALRGLRESKKGIAPAIESSPPYGWHDLGEIEHAGVLWKVQARKRWPTKFPSPYGDDEISPDKIEVKKAPRCPKCRTELQVSPFRPWSGRYFTWQCPNCAFKERRKGSYLDVIDAAEKIAKRIWEIKIQER